MEKTKETVRSVFVALFAALICASAFIAIPTGPLGVSIVVQNMMCILAGCILGSVQGAASVGLVLIAGALGLPVLSAGKSGIATLLAPTGGFYYGWFLGALVAGIIARRPKNDEKISLFYVLRIVLASFAGFVCIYLPAVPWAVLKTGKELSTIMAGYVLPFLFVDFLKMCATVGLSLALRKVAARYLD